MNRCTTAALPATLAHPLKTTAVTTRSNVGALNRMRGSDAIGRGASTVPRLAGKGRK